MIKSESQPYHRENLAIGTFKSLLADILLEAAAIKNNSAYSINKNVVDRFNDLAKNSLAASANSLSEYATLFHLLSQHNVNGQSLVTLDLNAILKDSNQRDQLISGLETIYNRLKSTADVSTTSSSSFFLLR